MIYEFNKLCEKAIKKFGYKIQLIIAMEEASEFIQALSKILRISLRNIDVMFKDNLINNLISEIVDLEIMLLQVKTFIELNDNYFTVKYTRIQKEKLENLKHLLKLE